MLPKRMASLKDKLNSQESSVREKEVSKKVEKKETPKPVASVKPEKGKEN